MRLIRYRTATMFLTRSSKIFVKYVYVYVLVNYEERQVRWQQISKVYILSLIAYYL